MLVHPPVENNDIQMRMFIDYDKAEKKFYNNLYLENYRVVIKMPFIQKQDPDKNIKIDKFDLNNFIYICDYR